MSHIATIKLEIKDINAFGAACRSLGLVILPEVTRCQWEPGATQKCDYVMQLGSLSNYQLGLQRQTNGSYSLIQAAWVPNQLRDVIGDKAINLQDAYAREVAIAQLQSEGYSVTTWTNDQGEIVVEAYQ